MGAPREKQSTLHPDKSKMSLLDDYDVDIMHEERLCPHMRELVTLSVVIKGSVVPALSRIDPSHWYCIHCNQDCPDLDAAVAHSDTKEWHSFLCSSWS